MTASPESVPLTKTKPRFHMGGLLALGFVTDFFDTLGIGSFATTTTALRLGKIVDDEEIPGTLNVGHAIPSMLEAALFLTAIEVDLLTLVTMVTAAGLGAWFGTGSVVHWPKRLIQLGMAISLLITASLIVFQRQLGLFPTEGVSLGLTGIALLAGVAASAVIGSLTSLGIGNYAPTMAVTYLLGMSEKAVFPVMAASAALILPAAAIRFYRSGRFNRRTAIGLTLGGVPGVLVAFYIVKKLPLYWLRWIVVAVLIYTSIMLYLASRSPEVGKQ